VSYLQIRISTRTNSIPTFETLARIPHDVERVDMDAGDDGDRRYRPNVGMSGMGIVRRTIRESGKSRPEIYRVEPDHTTPIAERHQWLWKDINPELSGIRWATLLGNKLAWTNSSGFPGRRDYINNLDMDKSLPNFDAARVNGGMIVKITIDGNIAWIDSLLTSDPVPSVEYFLNTHRWSWGTGVTPKGTINYIPRLGIDGMYKHVRIPLITKQKIWLPIDELHILKFGEPIPNPTWRFNQ
jgi:hypothetical protein